MRRGMVALVRALASTGRGITAPLFSRLRPLLSCLLSPLLPPLPPAPAHALVASLLGVLAPAVATARVLDVGPGKLWSLPGPAAAQAHPGDVIRIAPGVYADCMVITADRVTIEGTGPDVVLADRTCQGKGILVISGRDVIVRGLTLRGARVPDRNGAGIRAQGGNLTVENTRFLDNENGILSGSMPAASIHIRDSTFIGNGRCDPVCAHGLYAGQIGLLRIERSRFLETRAGHHIKSRATRTEIVDSDIADGPNGTASYLVDIPNGGDVLIERTRLSKGPHSGNATAAIMIGAEGATIPTLYLRVRGNHFENAMGREVGFVVNRTRTLATLERNRLSGPVRALEGPGTVR